MNIALIGYGKMGRAVEKILKERGHMVGYTTETKTVEDQNAPGVLVQEVKKLTAEDLQGIDVAIEFTNPFSAPDNIKTCAEAGVPIVVGTTGWYDQFDSICQYITEKNSALFYATNFSIGVNLFFELNKKLASLMDQHSDYEVDMQEIHHTQKLDAPSGTAITLAEGLLNKLNRKNKWVSLSESDKANDNPLHLNIVSKRIDDVPGTHRVSYRSEIDDIEIIHTAHNRRGFALGAVLAAEWLEGKRGIFSMSDMLSL